MEPKKTIVIVGSLTSSSEQMNEVFNTFNNLGIEVIKPEVRSNKYKACYNYISNIHKADMIIAVPKPDRTFGDYTTYEIALAKYLKKPVYIFFNDNPVCDVIKNVFL